MYSNLKIVPLLLERETLNRVVVLSSAMKVQREREREKVCSSERRKHTLRSLSLSLCCSSSSALFSLCGFRAFFLSLFFKSYYEGEDGKKNEERKKSAKFCLCA